MDPIKKLAGQTAVYGLGTIVPRLLSWLFLTPFFTRIFSEGEYGVVTELYAYVILLLAILTYGMETGFFRFSESEKSPVKVYSTSFIAICVTTLIFIAGVNIFIEKLSGLIQYSSNQEYIKWFSLIVGFDVVSSIPFAWLRKQNKAKKFAVLKIINVSIHILLIFFFYKLCPILENNGNAWIKSIYNPDMGVAYVFISNLIASSVTMILIIPVILEARFMFSFVLFRKMISYCWPLVIVGIAAAINEAGDKIMLKYLLPEQFDSLAEVGVYGANYKVAVLMTLFVQMFRYAFEPFFFARAKFGNAKIVYADIMKYFIIAGLVIFLIITMYLDVVKYYIDAKFYGGLYVVPIVLMANLILGIYYNLSVWYKLTDKTKYAALMSITGMIVTIVINMILIPKIYYLGSAWATLFCFLTMVIFSYFLGKKHYLIKYDIKNILFYFGIAILLFFIFDPINKQSMFMELLIKTIPIVIFIGIVEYREKISRFIYTKSA